MLKVFEENDYDFMDATLSEIKLDKNTLDYLVIIDTCLGENKQADITIRLKNVKKINATIQFTAIKEKDTFTPYSLSHISKIRKGKNIELMIFSTISMLPAFEKNSPLFYFLCEEAYIE